MSDGNPHFSLDRPYWSRRYREGQTGWDLRSPTPALRWLCEQGLFPIKPPASILVPGCGYGHDALYLARQGYAVTALDWAPEALSALQTYALPSLQTVCTDFFAYAEGETHRYDAIWEYTFYCAIAPASRSAYFQGVSRLLRAEGYWIALLFPVGSQPYAEGPPFAVFWEEVLMLAPQYHLIPLQTFSEVPSHPARQGREILVCFQKTAPQR